MDLKKILCKTGKYLIVEPLRFITGYYHPKIKKLREEIEQLESQLKTLDSELEKTQSGNNALKKRKEHFGNFYGGQGLN